MAQAQNPNKGKEFSGIGVEGEITRKNRVIFTSPRHMSSAHEYFKVGDIVQYASGNKYSITTVTKDLVRMVGI